MYLWMVFCFNFWNFRSAGSHLIIPGKACSHIECLRVTELCIAWKFGKLKMYVLFLPDLGFEMYCQSLWFCFCCGFFCFGLWGFFFGGKGCGVGWFVLGVVLVTHFDITFGCTLPQLENKSSRAVEGTKQNLIPGEYVLFCASYFTK